MASDSKHADAAGELSVHVDKLVISPEETKDLCAPVSVDVQVSVSKPLQCPVWVLRLEVDMSSDANTERHVLPLAAQCAAAGSSTCCGSLASPVWPAASLEQAQAEGSTGALLRLSLYDAPGAAAARGATAASEGKGGDDSDALEALVSSTAGLPSLFDASCLVDVEGDEGGSPVRNIYNPFE